MKTAAPRVEIDLKKIRHNALSLKKRYGEKGIDITGVLKGVGASLEIANVFIESGITSLADSNIANIKRMKEAGLKAEFMLIRTPAPGDAEPVVRYADISLNSELDVIRALSSEAVKQNKVHSIIIMVEMGDLREGVLIEDVPAFIEEAIKLPGIRIAGIGTNFACFGGILPTDQKMREFSDLAKGMEAKFSLPFTYVSGGNSANYQWMINTKDPGAVNHIRLGESILLGRETAGGMAIPGLYQDAFTLVAEVIESKRKPSVPFGERGTNAFGENVSFQDRGIIRRAIVALGRQDVLVSGLTPLIPVEILGSSSDHIILDAKQLKLKPGDEVRFAMNYGALLSVMTSIYVHKTYFPTEEITNLPA